MTRKVQCASPLTRHAWKNMLKIWDLPTQDVFENLAIEDYLFRHLDETPALLLWQNAPCIVIGRAQNPWIECDLNALYHEEIPLARRQSGGGTVYHDSGNLNFTFFSPKADFDKQRNLQIITTALQSLNIEAKITPRNDIVIKEKDGDKKISGSAFRENKDFAFHHGTLLIDTDLERLTRYLNPHKKAIVAKGVPSVRSQVTNLILQQPGLTVNQVKTAIIEAFAGFYQLPYKVKLLEAQDQIKTGSEYYRSFDWRFAHTMPFEHSFTDQNHSVKLVVEAGCVKEVIYVPTADHTFNQFFEKIRGNIINQRYEHQTLKAIFNNEKHALIERILQEIPQIEFENKMPT